MATKRQRPTEEARRRIQRGRDTLANAVEVTLGPLKEGDVAREKEFDALNIPKGGRTVRKMAVPARRYWPSANSQRAPSRPLGTKKAPR
jgi:chaperonin GroEL (HSP60 family)